MQSNGFLALMESAFGKQMLLVPAPVEEAPGNRSDRLEAMEIDSPSFVDASGQTFEFAASPAKRKVIYFPDKTVYQAAFEHGPDVSLTVYPVYGKSAAVFLVRLERSDGPVEVVFETRGKGFQRIPSSGGALEYGSQRWSYRLVLAATGKTARKEETLRWNLRPGQDGQAVVALGATESEARATVREVEASRDLLAAETHQGWNAYLASVPLVVPAEPIHFTIATTGEERVITPEELLQSELWTWRGVLTDTVQVPYLAGTPLVLADWFHFFGMWGNDGIAESLSLAATGRKDISRASILNWFRYGVNAEGDGTAAWTIFPSGRNTFAAAGLERDTQSVPLQAALVGQYVRLTGDVGILDAKSGGAAKNRTLWQSLVAYQQNLRKVRDINDDHLIDWTHTYETGWDDKNAPFVDRHGAPTSTVNEQVDNLWSLEEMVYLAKLRGEGSASWQLEFDAAKSAIREKLWDSETKRYWDLDVSAGKLWTQGENLDAYDFLYYESDSSRIAAMMKRFEDPEKFNGSLLPTLAFDTPTWGGYWRGPSWPREYAQVTLALSRAGYGREAFTWLARAINTNLGPIIPENIDPKTYPGKRDFSGVRIMGYTGLDCLAFPDVAGLRIWAGQDLTVKADPSIGRVFVRGVKWMGDSYDAVFDPNKLTLLWRNGKKLQPLAPNQIWRAKKNGQKVSFEPLQANSSQSTAERPSCQLWRVARAVARRATLEKQRPRGGEVANQF